jgi:predicted RNA binding protein YcfA (HicA-like mRNA interferase family)
MDRLLEQIRQNPRNVRLDDLRKLCDWYLGEPRQRGSHLIYRTPWPGQPLVNIQPTRGMAKLYQVRQVLSAIERLEENDG